MSGVNKKRWVPVTSLAPGDTVYIAGRKETVAGIGGEQLVDGHDVTGVPYVNIFCTKSPERDLRNYLFNLEYQLAK